MDPKAQLIQGAILWLVLYPIPIITSYKASEYDLWKLGKYCRPIENIPATLKRNDLCSDQDMKTALEVDFYHFAPEDPYTLKIHIKSLQNFEFNYVAAMDIGFGIFKSGQAHDSIPVGRFRGASSNCRESINATADDESERVVYRNDEDVCGTEKTHPLGKIKYAGLNRYKNAGVTFAETIFYWSLDWNIPTTYKTTYNYTYPPHVLFRFMFINTLKVPPEVCGPIWTPFLFIGDTKRLITRSSIFHTDSLNEVDCSTMRPIKAITDDSTSASAFELNDEVLVEGSFKNVPGGNSFNYDFAASPLFTEVLPKGGRETKWDWDSTEPEPEPDSGTINPDEVVEHITDECAKTKGCIGDLPKCVENNNCSIIITWSKLKESPNFKFEMMARLPQGEGYVAMGLSKNKIMDDDLVIECVRHITGEIGVYQSWNRKRNNSRIHNENCHRGLSNCSVVITTPGKKDLKIYCSFIREKKIVYTDLESTTRQKYKFDISSNVFYLLGVRGEKLDKHNILMHTKDNIFISKYPIDFTGHSKIPEVFPLKFIHVIAMTFCWIVFIPNAIFISRYLKETCLNKACSDRKLWFFAHTNFALLGFTSLLIAISCILFAKQKTDSRWPTIKSIIEHAKYGGAASALLFFQVVSGWYRPMGHHSRRTYAIFHSIIGNSGYFAALKNIFSSYYLGMPCNIIYYVGGAVGWTLFCHLAMAYHFWWLDTNLGLKKCRALRPMPIKVVLYEDAPGRRQRKRIFIVHLIGSIGFALTISLMFFFHYQTCECEEPDYCK